MIQGENEYVNRSKTNKIDGMVAARLPEQNAAVMSCIPIEGSFAFAPSCFGSILNIKSSCFRINSQQQALEGHSVKEYSPERQARLSRIKVILQ
jgi:hypothetical protein